MNADFRRRFAQIMGEKKSVATGFLPLCILMRLLLVLEIETG